MRLLVCLFALVAAVICFAGCGDEAPAPPPTTTAPPTGEIAVTLTEGVQVVNLTGDDNMHYNGDHFNLHAGQPVRVVLEDIGRKPLAMMAHNFVLLKPGTNAETFALMANTAKDEDYLPASQMASVLAHSPFAGPGQTVQVEFTAPPPGEYPFLCTFPGHYAAGMKGTVTVVP